ncbi:nicotinate-nicotinamide nucleotide adenylyltransferase [Photobacterium swingsii]|uniref:nicotinate-nucleotide adenylyltransferase n=1 Tax=Photobacterium swingsii TaxID=680026 RepID=A0A0J8VGH9_9GAMM|nr:nicotinate-nicotinamide nucleotide adenylyltransferase [Photobacterium swingsii]KMV31595.1 nicotinic acid mononucleotide adenylyltransferase [Photobacterium swingsii]PSW24856.1 nicotinate-nicotinamide nucleotide adenylyltransferase [Photobacterium swingsii]
MSQSIAVFGSAFNPPSLGHLSVLKRLSRFDRVLLLPSYAHAWGKVMLDYDARCELVSAFIEDSGQANLELCRIEETMAVGDEAITTYAVLTELQKQIPDAELTFVIGPDNLASFHKFYKADAITASWQVLACPETLKIRSTLIRDKLAGSCSVSQLTTPKVATMLMEDPRFKFG